MKKINIIACVFLLTISSLSYSQVTLSGGKGQLRVFDAETVYPGHLYINATYSGYAGEKETKSTFEDHTLNLSFTLGLAKSFDMFIHLVPYQDDQKNAFGPPGDSKLGIKYQFQRKDAVTNFAILGFVSFPTAQHHNVLFEPYSSDATGWGIMGLTTFDLKNTSGMLPLKISLNVGYWDHDMADRFFSDKTDQLIGGFGFKFPVRSSLLYSEITGELFINNGDNVTFSQNSIRFTQGLRFLGPLNLVFDIAGDIELGGYKPSELELSNNPYLKDYADWKILVGATYRTTLFSYKTKEQKIKEEQRKQEENKLDSIRDKREKVAKELEELRKKLEKEKNKEPLE